MHVSSRARRYARAALKVVSDPEAGKRLLTELEGVLGFLEERPVGRLVLESPATAAGAQRDLLAAIARAHDFAPTTLNLLRLLVDNRCVHLLDEVAEAIRGELRAREGVVLAHVRTADPLGPEEEKALKESLRAATGCRDVELDVEEDPSLVAGAVTQIGSVVYDGSLAHHLGRLREQLISE